MDTKNEMNTKKMDTENTPEKTKYTTLLPLSFSFLLLYGT